MFDAKSILESLITGGQRGGSTTAGRQGDPLSDLLGGSGGGGLGDLLRNMVPNQGTGQTSGQTSSSSGQQGDPLSDLLGKLGGGSSSGGSSSSSTSGSDQGGLGGLGDLLGKLGQGSSQGSPQGSSGGNAPGGNITDILGNMFEQAKEGTREGAKRVDDATGASDKMGDLARQLSGKSPEELMAALKDLISNNKLGAGAALGGLGALILGTQTGRSAAVTAAKLGAIALIGGLAYKAYQNYQQGGSEEQAASGDIEAPPSGSGFEPDTVSNDDAILMIRTMIAAAAADGRIDASEQERILGSLKQGNGELEPGAEEFLARELNAPASARDIANAVQSKQQAAKIYSAARIAVDPDTRGEQDFLYELAQRLNIDQDLARHINAAARNA
ncbi:MAG: tellurite resistance TerB family protein [Alphaproteobacteria bacterium]|nr:tellurite resistance TerB family protein [Alphaproteobacteria bacterium]